MNFEVVREYQDAGFLRTSQHPKLDLHVWNYSALAQTNNLWDQVTLEARGLVTDSRGQVIGRSSSKFFNQGSRYAHVPADPTSFRVQEKLDGSLGLIFHYHGAWHVASHCSFISRQAVLSAEMLQKYSIAGLDTSLCYACELIHPSNRLIVEYGSQADLVILAAFHRDGSEVFPLPPQLAAAGFPVVRTFSGAKLTDLDTLRHLEWQNAEGHQRHVVSAPAGCLPRRLHTGGGHRRRYAYRGAD